MALTVINRQGLPEIFGTALGQGLSGLGQGFGQNLSTGINSLVNLKMNDIVQRQQRHEKAKGLSALGLPAVYASLPDNVLGEIIKEQFRAPREQAYAQALGALFGAPTSQHQTSQTMKPEFTNESYEPSVTQAPNLRSAETAPSITQLLASGKAASPMQALMQTLQTQPFQEAPPVPQEITSTPQISRASISQPMPASSEQTRNQAIAQALSSGRLSAQQANQLALFAQKRAALDQKERQLQQRIERDQQKEEKKYAVQEQRDINKETLPIYNEIIKSAKTAKENDKRLARMEELNESGNFGLPIVNSTIKTLSKGIFGFGIDLSHLMTADAQEMEKLSNDFVKGAKSLFGARLTDTDLKTFLSTVPNLSQSKAGREKVIRNLKLGNEADKARFKAMQEIIKENNGKRPANLEFLIEDRASPELDRLAEEFKSGPIGIKEPFSVSRVLNRTLGLSY